MPLTFVGSTHANPFNGQITRSVTAGNHLFLASVVSLSVDVEATGATDNQSNAWQRDASGNSANRHLAIFHTVAGATGSLTVQLAVSGTLDSQLLELAEFSGTLDAAPFDVAAAVASGTGTTVTGNGATPSQAECFLFGLGGVDFTGTVFTPSAPWTDRTNNPGERCHIASREVAAIASYSLSGTLNASESWGVIMAAYRFPATGDGDDDAKPTERGFERGFSRGLAA